MSKAFTAILLIAFTSAVLCQMNQIPSIAQTNQQWETAEYDQFEGMTDDQFVQDYLMNVENIILPADVDRVSMKDLIGEDELPTQFDSLEKWPQCMHEIRAQLKCGSCWAFSGSEVLSDRVCIASQGAMNVVLSPQHMVSCDKTNMGCKGGRLPQLWKFLETNGIVADSCFPYHSGDGSTYECSKFGNKCEDGQPALTYFATQKGSKCLGDAETIKHEIMTNGPIQAGFMVYADFKQYKTGVYVPKSSVVLGGHAIKIIGWGEENGIKYWKCANSWGATWGENGYFRIQQGTCGMDANTFVGQVDMTRSGKAAAQTF